jgi:hypothetical protein
VQADYVQAFYPEDKLSVYENTLDEDGRKKAVAAGFALVTQEMLQKAPEQYVLQLDYANLYELIDLKDVVSYYFHMDGAPLGSYDPSYQKMFSVLETLKIPYEYKGLGGHAAPYYLRHMVDTIAPKTLIPLHSFRPEQVNSSNVKERFLPKYGESYRLGRK